MTRAEVLLTTVAFTFAILGALPANAQQTYTAVSASGLPGPGTCGKVTNPCKSLQAAFDVTADNGVIDVLEPGNYGPVNITHAVSIQGHGFASVAVTSGAAITVPTSGSVSLDGLQLDGAGLASYGIYQNAAAGTLQITNCLIKNFYDGILIDPTSGDIASVTIKNTTVLNNGNAGVYITPTDTSVYGSIDQVTANSNAYGMYFDASHTTGLLQLEIANGRAYNNTNTGVVVNPGGTMFANFKNTRVRNNNDYDVVVNGASVALFFDRNELGFVKVASGSSYSDGTNYVFSLVGAFGSITLQ
jgi:hypothetical protein